MLFFLNIYYTPNTANTNRLLGYYSAIDKMKIDAKIVYLMPQNKGETPPSNYKYVKNLQILKGRLPKLSIVRLLLFRCALWRFLKLLKEGDVVYTYGVNQATKAVLSRKGVRCYCERTEHPIVKTSGRLIGLKESEKMQIMKKMDGLFVISNTLKDYFISEGFNPNQIHVINMIVDPSRFKSIEKQKVDCRYIAYCGTALNSKDGVDELIKAFAIVAKKISDVKLYIIGQTPDKDDFARNMKLIESLQLKDRVVFTGKISADIIPQLLKNAEVLALDRPDSIQAQCGFPTKLGEYLLTENPVVVTKVGDIPRFLKDGESALLAEERNAEDFSSKLIWVLEHPSEAKIIGECGKTVALKFFNNENEAKKLISVMLPHALI